MIIEAAILSVRAELKERFGEAFRQASPIIAAMPGYLGHDLHRCLETADRYLLLVEWDKLEDHTVGFRQSEQYQQWKKPLHHFHDPFPLVERFGPIDIQK